MASTPIDSTRTDHQQSRPSAMAFATQVPPSTAGAIQMGLRYASHAPLVSSASLPYTTSSSTSLNHPHPAAKLPKAFPPGVHPQAARYLPRPMGIPRTVAMTHPTGGSMQRTLPSMAFSQPASTEANFNTQTPPQSPSIRTNGRVPKRGPYRCSRCGQMLKGHQCPFKDYSPRSPRHASARLKRASTSDLDDVVEAVDGQPARQRARSRSALALEPVADPSHRMAAWQLLSISKTSSPPVADTGDVMARFMARLVTEHNIPHSDLTDLFNSCLQTSLDDPPSASDIASVYTLSAVRNMIHLQALATVDDSSKRKCLIRGLSLSGNRLYLHVGGDGAKSQSEDSSDDDQSRALHRREPATAQPKPQPHPSTAVNVMLAAASASHAASAESSESRAESAASELEREDVTEDLTDGSAHQAWQHALDTAVNAKSLEVTSPEQPLGPKAKDV
eukprot:m.47357 g.47357  ORF g.47357 m.47357 type:complete len:448 (-) comp13218_c0_seq1:90-1433(-)